VKQDLWFIRRTSTNKKNFMDEMVSHPIRKKGISLRDNGRTDKE
jgi:hypothetical protein